MNFYVMTLFPEMIRDVLGTSITGRAIGRGLIKVEAVNIRDYTSEKHGKTDDYPYGGGAGMLMQVQPVYDCYRAVLSMIKAESNSFRTLYMSPQGEVFTQKKAEELSKEENLIFLCGHYEGIDERALELLNAEELSIGDFVLTGGELPACAMIDCISRLIPGVLGSLESAREESFHDNLLEYPQYSRPEEYMGLKVPEVLLSGHHANVEKWRREQAVIRTFNKRPEMLEGANLTPDERELVSGMISGEKED